MNEWISVGERLPDKFEDIEVRGTNGAVSTGWWTGEGFLVETTRQWIGKKFENRSQGVTHWKYKKQKGAPA